MRIRPWYFLVLFVISATISVFALKSNNIEMGRLRDQVFQADKNNGDVEAALQELRTYVLHHMNTNLASGNNAVRPPIQLLYTYDRLTQAQLAGARTASAEIYPQAQKYCEQAVPNGVSGRYRLACVQSYIGQRSDTSPPPIPKNLYQFDFATPFWSPDLAGWSVLVSLLLLIAFVVGILYRHVLRYVLRRAGRNPKD